MNFFEFTDKELFFRNDGELVIIAAWGGTQKYDSEVKISLPDIDFVILTPTQYGSLIEKYGYELLRKALLILEEWLKSSPEGEKYRGKNNYAHFRSDGWVINSAKITR